MYCVKCENYFLDLIINSLLGKEPVITILTGFWFVVTFIVDVWICRSYLQQPQSTRNISTWIVDREHPFEYPCFKCMLNNCLQWFKASLETLTAADRFVSLPYSTTVTIHYQ